MGGVGRRSVVLRLDRRRASQSRRQPLHDPLHAATRPQHLEREEPHLVRFRELTDEGRVKPAGKRAFEARDEARTNQYSFEQADLALTRTQEREFRANKKAWAFFQRQAPGYQRLAIHWVGSAVKEETRLKRLSRLIEESANGRRL